jgi:hypothetical protein
LTGAGLPPVCGNGVIETGEACEFGDLSGEDCNSQTSGAQPGGNLACTAGTCTFDTTGCVARFVDNGNGTVTDNQTKLVWEQKTTAVGSGTDFTNAHDVDNHYGWSTGWPCGPTGAVFTDFLYRLNGGTSPDGVSTSGCFAGHCDWRLPTIEELRGILLSAYPCGSDPCLDPAFGPTESDRYWSSTTDADDPCAAWHVNFNDGRVNSDSDKGDDKVVRAVRGGL